MDQQHVFDFLPGYALGILDEAEKTMVQNHLSVCAHCRDELAGYQMVMADLPLAVKTNPPPDYIKAGIMKRVRPERKDPGAVERVSIFDRLIQMLQGRAPLWGALSLVLVLALAVSNLFLLQRVNRLSAIRDSGQEKLITVVLHGTDRAPQAIGMLVMDSHGDYGVLVVDSLPQLTGEQQYQLWLIEDGQRTSGGVFSVNEGGYGSIVLSSPVQPLTLYPSFGITIEPLGGSPGPTGEKVLGGEF